MGQNFAWVKFRRRTDERYTQIWLCRSKLTQISC